MMLYRLSTSCAFSNFEQNPTIVILSSTVRNVNISLYFVKQMKVSTIEIQKQKTRSI